MDKLLKLVLIDDDPLMADVIQDVLKDELIQVFTAVTGAEGLALVQEQAAEIVLLDLRLPDMSGLELLEKLIARDPKINVILITGHYTSETAVEAIQKGACDYLNKPVSIHKLRALVKSLVDEDTRRKRMYRIEGELLHDFQFENFIGSSPLMLEVFSQIKRVAPHYRTALVSGATGTGKELAARALHNLSPVAKGPFITINASAVVETLFESELFGHVKGAFTGALADKIGLFESANHGTIFLDEISEMPLLTQSKLLRVVQQQEVQRVGSTAARKIDVRIIAATNRDLIGSIATKDFREDLYYRLSMVEISLPALKDRKEDLRLLQRHFIQKFATQYKKPMEGITQRAQAFLVRHNWPGNVRELENVIGHACMVANGSFIDISDLPPRLSTASAIKSSTGDDLITLDEALYRHASAVVAKVATRQEAAEVLGVSRTTLYRLLQKKPVALHAEHAAPAKPTR